MFGKIRENYKLANLLLRIAFILTYMFATWQQFLGASVVVKELANYGVTLGASFEVWVAVLSSLLVAVALMFLLPVFTNVFLNAIKNYNVPRAEYSLVAYAFFSMGFLALGLLNLVNLFTPLMLVWGGILFRFAVFVVDAFFFYKVTAKLYFNDVTVVHYFKGLMIAYAVLFVLLGVLL